MPLSIDTTVTPPVLLCQGIVSIEETDQLLEAIREHPGIVADLSGCEHLHTAPLQALKILKVPVTAFPDDPFWQFLFDPYTLTLAPEKETDAP